MSPSRVWWPYFMGFLIVNTDHKHRFLVFAIEHLSGNASISTFTLLATHKNRTTSHITVNHIVWRKSSYLNCHFWLIYIHNLRFSFLFFYNLKHLHRVSSHTRTHTHTQMRTPSSKHSKRDKVRKTQSNVACVRMEWNKKHGNNR